MLPRQKRLTTPLFSSVFLSGKVFHSASFSVRALKILKDKEEIGQSRFGISVTKKVAKTAVLRNTIKRKMYSAIGNVEKRIKLPVHLVFVMKMPQKNYEKEIQDIFVKMGILE